MKKVTITGFVNAAKRAPVGRPRAAKAKRAPAKAKRAPAKRTAPKRVYQVYQDYGKTSMLIASCASRAVALGIAAQLNRVAESGVKFVVR